MKRVIPIFFLSISLLSTTGCTEIQPDEPGTGEYSTQTALSYPEYSMYMTKQITVYASQLTTRMGAVKNSDTADREQELMLAEESLEIMQDVLDEVTVTRPATTADDDREATISAMETAVSHMEDYISALENQEATDAYADTFLNDFNALTGLANLYYQ